MINLIGCNTTELQRIAQEQGEPAYRGKQLAAWLYQRSAESFDAMSDIPRSFRERLASAFRIELPAVAHRDAASDGTVKYLTALEDGERVECVLLPYPDRVSVCLSTQVGCPAGCAFCATAQGGLARNLTAGEIVGQFLRMQSESERRVSHVVYMGMGEPLWNYDAVLHSVRILGGEIGLSFRNMTLSTVGVVPGILRLAEEGLPVTLALSLHAPDDVLREQLIPTARKWKLAEILDACRVYTERTRRDLTFEYLLIAGVNDSAEQARALALLLREHGLPGNVNLIPFNYVETSRGFRQPSRESVRRFREVLEQAGRVTTQRMTRGQAIAAACGQLRRRLAGPAEIVRL